jgi:glutamyl/glutaminyl-tRNA synthetase
MAVLRPLKVVIDNYPEGQVEEVDAVNNPEDESAGKRKVPFSKVLYIEQDDFREDPPKQYYRLSPGREVRLRYGYFITAKTVVKNDRGEVVEVHCTYDPATRGGNAVRPKVIVRIFPHPAVVDLSISEPGAQVQSVPVKTIPRTNRAALRAELESTGLNPTQVDVALKKLDDPNAKPFILWGEVKSTIHWVSAAHALDAEVRIYDKLFTKEDPNQVEEGQEFTANLDPNSLEVIAQAKLEPSVANAPIQGRYQFERLGYFCVDPDSRPGCLVFNRTVALKDAWAKIEKKSRS